MSKVQIRIEGRTKSQVYNAARVMGVIITKVYAMRNGHGYMGYGYSKENISEEYNAAPDGYRAIPGTGICARVL
jgi:hypothetical protein